MHTIHIGFSRSVGFREMQRLLDVDPTHPRGFGPFRLTFLSGPVRPGDYEIFAREEVPEGFTREALARRFPFDLPETLRLFEHDLANATIVFYVHSNKHWMTDDALGLKITDMFEIEKFGFE
jgi:hypothetical protein